MIISVSVTANYLDAYSKPTSTNGQQQQTHMTYTQAAGYTDLYGHQQTASIHGRRVETGATCR